MKPPTSAIVTGKHSVVGTVTMLVGLGFVLFELLTNFMLNRQGWVSHWLIFVVGTSLSIWGLKEIITSLWPWLGQRGRRFRLPVEGALYLVIMIVLLIGSLIGHSNTLMMVFALMIGPLIMNGNVAFVMLRGLDVSRELPNRVMAGEPFTVTLLLENSKRFLSAWVMVVRDMVRNEQGALRPEVIFMRIPPRSIQRGHYEMRLHERGEYEFGPITVDTRFPLGLIERGVGLAVTGKLLVYPRVGHMLPRGRRNLASAMELVTQVRPKPGPFNDEMHNIREYRTGDDPRMIHWRTTARMSELMVKEFRENRDRNLQVVVDVHMASPRQEPQAELLLRFAVTLCLDQLRSSRDTTLNVQLVGEEILDWFGEFSEGQPEQLLDQFARVKVTMRQPVSRIIELLQSHRQSDRRLLVLTTRAPELRAALASGNALELQSGDVQIVGCTADELELLYDDSPV